VFLLIFKIGMGESSETECLSGKLFMTQPNITELLTLSPTAKVSPNISGAHSVIQGLTMTQCYDNRAFINVTLQNLVKNVSQGKMQTRITSQFLP
jgi:hypothetical protein